MALTAQELLEQVDQAIFNITVGGQSYRIGSRQLDRANLDDLYKIKNNLEAQLSGSTPGLLDNCYVGFFEGR